jgi:hypothetical protein
VAGVASKDQPGQGDWSSRPWSKRRRPNPGVWEIRVIRAAPGDGQFSFATVEIARGSGMNLSAAC